MSGILLRVKAGKARVHRQVALEPVSFALGAVVPKLQVAAGATTDVRVQARTEAV